MRTEDDMTEMTGNPLIRESPCYSHSGLSQATDHAQASDQSAQELRVIHYFELSPLDQVLSLPCMRTKDDMNKLTGNPLIRESRDYRHCGLPQATDHAQATDQSAQEPRVIHCFELVHLWIRS